MTQTYAMPAAGSWRALFAPGIAQALIALDYAIVYVALPTLAQDLSLSLSEMQWVVSLYGLTFAALLLAGGSLCDRLGARRMFSLGMALFFTLFSRRRTGTERHAAAHRPLRARDGGGVAAACGAGADGAAVSRRGAPAGAGDMERHRRAGISRRRDAGRHTGRAGLANHFLY
ncbi:Methyl viologen resistance protein SmvA [Cedecea neteri]|uniref:Methyl viologen resistance protein SmvA n=1 Tax=Cedecea neteri TaxID=158822 RepID=A0A2X2T5M4_9ENTR|nr:Methyl viologen resistance protein SmvA [Cedecea neteri]